jgi:hypothetical protein
MKNLSDYLSEHLNDLRLELGSSEATREIVLESKEHSSSKHLRKLLYGPNLITEKFQLFKRVSENPSLMKGNSEE